MTKKHPSLTVYLTATRAALIPLLLYFITRSVALTALTLAVFVGMDIADGVSARRHGVETRRRRIFDSTLDKVAIHSALIVAAISHPTILLPYVLILSRDATQAALSIQSLRLCKTLLVGGRLHAIASFSDAAFGMCIITGNTTAASVAGVIAVCVNMLFLTDYAGGFVTVRRRPKVAYSTRFTVARLTGSRTILQNVVQAITNRTALTSARHEA